MHRGLNPFHVRIASVSHPCYIRVVRIKSVSHSHHIRIESAAMIIWPSRSTFVRITSVRRPCRVRVTSLPYPCVNLRKDMPRMWHEYDKDNTDAGRTWHEGDADLIRTFVRVSDFDCLKIIDTDKFGPGYRDGHNTDVIRTWTGRQGHDTDTCPCHVRVSIRVCVNKFSYSRNVNNSGPHRCTAGWIHVMSVSRPRPIRVVFALPVSNPCQTFTTFVSNPWSLLLVRPDQPLSVLHPYSVCVVSVSHPCHIHVPICTRICHGCDTNMTRTTRMQGGHDTEAIRIWYGHLSVSVILTVSK